MAGEKTLQQRSSRPPGQQQAVRELYSNRNFKLLWTGQLLSQIGDQCLLIAAITLISNLSRSPLALLIPAISMAIPQLIFFACAPNYTIVLVSITVIGACVVMARGALDTIAQTLSPDAVRRVAAAFILRGASRLMRQVTVT